MGGDQPKAAGCESAKYASPAAMSTFQMLYTGMLYTGSGVRPAAITNG